MSTVYTKTDNYGLNLYGDNDPADLRDGYNGSMNALDKALKQHLDRIANSENVSKALLEENTPTKAGEAKSKWDKAAADADYAKAKADGNANDIAGLTGKVNALTASRGVEYKSILAIGDSITFGTGTSSPARNNWVSNLAKLTKTDAGAITNLAENNAGFIAAGGGPRRYNFQQQLEYAKSLNITPECIIVAGGINDAWSSRAADIKTAVRTALSYASDNWPDAFIWYMPAPISRCIAHNAAKMKNVEVLPALIDGASGLPRVRTIRYAWEWLNPVANISGDGIHPNDLGAQMLAEFAYRSMQGETVRANRPAEKVTVTADKYNANELYVSVNNGFCQIRGHIGLKADVEAGEKIFQLPDGFDYSGILTGVISNAPATNNLYYPTDNSGNDVHSLERLPSQTTIYANVTWQIGVN